MESETISAAHRAVLLLPVITTICAALFCWQLFARYREKGGGRHLLWWGIGMATYGVGTFTEAFTSIAGWNPLVFRLWYASGAFLGGYPLAQGTIYLLMKRRFADWSAWIVSSLIAVASVLVFLTPLDASLAEAHRLSGAVIEWSWIRAISPFINLYAVTFLVGGAIVSAFRFKRVPELRHRYLGNIWIAVGAILPGIGGALTRAGYVEALYVTELVGLTMIYVGYRLNVARAPHAAVRDDAERKATMKKIAIASTILLLLSTAGSLYGQSPDEGEATEPRNSEQTTETELDEETPAFFEQTTVTATGSLIEAFQVANPVTVIESLRLEERQPENAADILREEVGVDVDGVGPNQMRPIIRGQRGLRILFLEDGLRMNNARRQTDFGEIPGLIDLDSVGALEVVRGPSSVLYGSDAIGGVMNLVTASPGMSGARFEGNAGVRYGSAAESLRGQIGVAGQRDGWAYDLGLSARDASDYDAAAGTFGEISLDHGATVIDSGVNDQSVFGKFGFDLGERNDLMLRFNRYRADDAGFGFVDPELLDDPQGARVRIMYPFQDFDRYIASFIGAGLESAAADTVEARLYYNDNERQLVNDIDINIGPVFPGAPDSSVEADTRNFTDLESLGLRAEASKGIANRHLLTYGLELFEDDSFNTDFSETTTVIRLPFPPFEVRDVSTDEIANAPNATNSSYGAFAQAQVAPTENLSLTFGLRHQVVETEARATEGWDTTGLGFDDDNTVGAFSLLYRASDSVHLVGSYGTAFRAPNIIERLFNGPTPEGIGFQILNPDLFSETSGTFDLGVKVRSRDGFFEVHYFETEIDDGIIQNFLGPDEIAQLPLELQEEIRQSGAIFVVQQQNIDRLQYTGWEVGGAHRFKGKFEVGGNYTYIDGERVDSTNPPTGDTFSDKVNAYLRYQPFGGRFWGEYRIRHNGDDKANLDPDEPVPPVGEILPSFTIHSLAGGVALFANQTARHELSAMVENLTDELYAEFSNAAFFRPQPGRNYRLVYRVRY